MLLARLRFITLIALLLGCHAQLAAHPLAPGLLALTETDTHQFQAVWKLPKKTADQGSLMPVLPASCKMHDLQQPITVGTGRSQSFKLFCEGALLNQVIAVTGMNINSSGVLLRIQFLDGRLIHHMLNYQNSELLIPSKQSLGDIFSRYTLLGIEHLIQGIDHVLFVITLALLVGWNRQLLWTVTLFTLGHSITLSLTTLGVMRFPVFFIEAIIALSIAWAAADIINRKQQGLLKQRPWLMSGGFGLLHGMGFAGALTEIGLPQQALMPALAAFNIGIEIGQLIVIAIFFSLAWVIYRLAITIPVLVKTASYYAIGITGAVWFWQRLLIA